MRDVTNDGPVTRALALIAPSKDRQQQRREDLLRYIKAIANDPPRVPRETRARLSLASKSLRTSLAAVRRLPRSQQSRLLPPLSQSNSLMDLLLHAPRLAELRLEIFLSDLRIAALSAELQSMRLKVPRSGGQPNYRKQSAAEFALLLLIQFGRKQPTLTPSGPFFSLASVLYEAVTGEKDANLERQCRVSHASHREWLRKQLPPPTVEQHKK
jgi:hypothetical protein